MEELFAKRLTELIKNSNYILADMEDAVGKKGATISRYASGEIKGVKRETIVKLANFFNVNPAWLAGLSSEKYITHTNSSFNESLQLKYGKMATELLDNYNKLNELGKQKANDNVKDLTKINEYTEKKTEIQNGDA